VIRGWRDGVAFPQTKASRCPSRPRLPIRHLHSGKIKRKSNSGFVIEASSFRIWLLLVALASCATGAKAIAADGNQAHAELTQAVLDGRDIRMTLDLAQCVVHASEKSGPPVRGSLRVEAAANYAMLQQADFDCSLGKGIQFDW
jgi:hypothetical protein